MRRLCEDSMKARELALKEELNGMMEKIKRHMSEEMKKGFGPWKRHQKLYFKKFLNANFQVKEECRKRLEKELRGCGHFRCSTVTMRSPKAFTERLSRMGTKPSGWRDDPTDYLLVVLAWPKNGECVAAGNRIANTPSAGRQPLECFGPCSGRSSSLRFDSSRTENSEEGIWYESYIEDELNGMMEKILHCAKEQMEKSLQPGAYWEPYGLGTMWACYFELYFEILPDSASQCLEIENDCRKRLESEMKESGFFDYINVFHWHTESITDVSHLKICIQWHDVENTSLYLDKISEIVVGTPRWYLDPIPSKPVGAYMFTTVLERRDTQPHGHSPWPSVSTSEFSLTDFVSQQNESCIEEENLADIRQNYNAGRSVTPRSSGKGRRTSRRPLSAAPGSRSERGGHRRPRTGTGGSSSQSGIMVYSVAQTTSSTTTHTRVSTSRVVHTAGRAFR